MCSPIKKHWDARKVWEWEVEDLGKGALFASGAMTKEQEEYRS